MSDVFVSRRYGDFRRLAEEVKHLCVLSILQFPSDSE